MKVFFLALVVAALSGGIAKAQESCVGNNSEHCRDARAAFAEHHNGESPNQWYQGHQGRWDRSGQEWNWRNNDDDREYGRGDNG